MLYCPPSLQQQKQNEPSDDRGEQINDVDLENEMPNIEKVKSLISKVQKNMANAINDDEIVETDHGSTDDLDETKSNFPTLKKFYIAVDGSISLEKFRDSLSCNKIEDISQLSYDGIFNIGLPYETQMVSKEKHQLRIRTKMHMWNVIH
jgi:hypothetical protein